MRSFLLSSLVLVCCSVCSLAAPFPTAPPAPFTQELWATDSGQTSPYRLFGGVAFAPDGDVWVMDCGTGLMRRFDAQATTTINGNSVHPAVLSTQSNGGCGLTNHPDGFLYSNTPGGVVRIDANTGLAAGGPFGPGGNYLGIITHPITHELIYVTSGSGLQAVDNGFTTTRAISPDQFAGFDGIASSTDGQFIFASAVSYSETWVIRFSDGAVVRRISSSYTPDGMAFHGVQKFVLANNIQGTLTRMDFPLDGAGNPDFTAAPTVTTFASGGSRGDLTAVGADRCLYLTQQYTRFDNGAQEFVNSVVRLCPDFVPGAGVVDNTVNCTSAPARYCCTNEDHFVDCATPPPAANEQPCAEGTQCFPGTGQCTDLNPCTQLINSCMSGERYCCSGEDSFIDCATPYPAPNSHNCAPGLVCRGDGGDTCTNNNPCGWP